MDSTFKSDISLKILETRKETEELKAKLQNLIDSGINSIEYKTISHSHQNKENITETQNKVQIIKSYDTAHSQHVIKPSSSKTNLSDDKRNTQPTECKKTRSYDVNKAREYIKRQREKRLEEQKLQNEKKIQLELQKKKLQELQKKSLELVKKNVQAKRERSKSRERIDFVRPVKDITRSRSSSRERDYVGRNKPTLEENAVKQGKLDERINKKQIEKSHKNPNLLYPPVPHYMLNTNQPKNDNLNKYSPATRNKIIILSGNSSDKVKSPRSKGEITLKPRNLFDITTVGEEVTITNTNSPNESKEMHTIRGNDIQKKNASKKLENGVEQKSLNPANLSELPHVRNSQSWLGIETNKDVQSINKIMESKKMHDRNISSTCLLFPENSNLISTSINIDKSNNVVKPKLSEVAIGTDNLEKITKETQTSREAKQEYPLWLQEKRYESNPLNFINSVKRKLQNAINSPKLYVDVGIQKSIGQPNLKSDSYQNKNEEIIELFNERKKSSEKSDLQSFMSHKCLNLDQKTIEHIELVSKKASSGNLATSKSYGTESESDTSKNIPEISSESGTSLKKNAESVKQNGAMGLDLQKLNSMKLNTHADKSIHSIQSNKTLQEKDTLHSSKISIKASDTKCDILDSKIETKKSSSRIFSGSDQYTSDFQSRSQSIITENSSLQKKNSDIIAGNNSDYILSDPKFTMYLKHSSAIPETSNNHSKNTKLSHSINSKDKYFKGSSRNITLRDNSLNKTNLEKNEWKETSSIKDPTDRSKSDVSSIIHTETDAKGNQSIYEEESQKNESKSTVRSSKKSDKFLSLYTDTHSNASVSEKSNSNLKYVNTRRGFHISSENNKYPEIPPLKEPTLSLVTNNEKNNNKLDEKENRNKLLKNISLRSDASKFADLNNTNEIHLKFEAEIHLLNDFNESLRQFSEVEKAFNSLKSKNDVSVAPNRVLQNRDTQTSAIAKSPTTSKVIEENVTSDSRSELSSINFSRGFLIDSTSLHIDDTSKTEDRLNLTVNTNLSNFENLHSNNFAGMTLRMFEQLIKDEDARLENLKTILKIREQALLDRTKGELAWLEIQRKHLRETGKLHQASLIKKKQRGILVNHQKERHEMQRLKQMQKAASLERKIILKEQRNLIKHQLSTDKMLSKIKVNTPRERRHSGPLKVIQSHTESIRSETSISKRSSSDKEAYSIMSHTQSVVSMVSEVSGDEVVRKTGAPSADFMDLAVKLPGDTCEVPISEIKRTLLIREAALQKRRKAAEELLQWHRKLLEEEKRITELESTANTIISQIPNAVPAKSDVNEKYQFKGKQLNQLWFNLTGCQETKFNKDKVYPMSQIALERFCKSAREYSIKTKKLKRISDSEVSENSEIKTDDSVSENIPNLKILRSASLRTESDQSEQSKTESVPITTANEYTSDFDIESLHEVVNIENMDVVDQSINELIDNFSKIQDDISLLGVKQSVKSDLEPDDSIKSDKTDSEVEVSVIETAKTSKETYFNEEELNEKNKVSSSSKNLSTLQDIVNNLSQDEIICDTKSSNKSVEDGSKSKSVEGEIVMEVSEVPSPEISSVEQTNLDKFKDIKSLDKTEVLSMIDKNSVTEDNLNKSQEILEELSNLENQIIKDTPNQDSTTEKIQIPNEMQDNLSKSEEILLRLKQSENESSITSEDNEDLENEVEGKDSPFEATDVLVELPPVDNKSISNASSVQALSKDETYEIVTGKISENKNEDSVHHSQDISSKESSAVVDEISLKTDDSKDIVSSEKLSLVADESSSIKDAESKEKDSLPKSMEGKVDLKSEIVSEEPIKTNESGEVDEIAEERTVNSAIDELSQNSNTPSSTAEDNLLHNHLASINRLPEKKEQELEGKDILGSTENEPEKITTGDLLSGDHVSLIINTSRLTVDEIPEDLESDKEADRLSSGEKTEHKSINENNADTKDESIYEVIISEATKITEGREIDDYSSKDSKKDTEDNRSKSSKTTVSESISVEKSPCEGDSDKLSLKNDVEHQSSSDIPSTTGNSEKSRVVSISEIVALSKEDSNSYEEKELDSSSPTTVSQSSIILSEKEKILVSETSEISTSEEKSPRSGSVDVKKRVSEIMADASPVSRGDKSPKLQDFYTTTYDLVSPANSPELGSPTEEHKFLTAKSIFGTEAEELLRKQLAIEQEIKQITEQQQKEQLPYLFVREIPNKPPPPYTPPSSLPAANVITIIPTSDEIEDITKYSAKILHKAYLSNNLENISISENTLSLISKDINKECYKFIFDLCKEIAKEHYKQFEKEECLSWLQVKKNPRLAVVKPLDVRGLDRHMSKKLKELFGYENSMRQENAIIKWSRKKRDHVDEILVMESQAEETQWTNYDKDELLVMNDVTNEIMNMLLKETGEVVGKILSKRTF